MPNEIKYIKIKDDLFFNVLHVKELEKQEIKIEPQNQFLIFDRSGSMYYYLNNLVDIAIEYCKNYLKVQLTKKLSLLISYYYKN